MNECDPNPNTADLATSASHRQAWQLREPRKAGQARQQRRAAGGATGISVRVTDISAKATGISVGGASGNSVGAAGFSVRSTGRAEGAASIFVGTATGEAIGLFVGLNVATAMGGKVGSFIGLAASGPTSAGQARPADAHGNSASLSKLLCALAQELRTCSTHQKRCTMMALTKEHHTSNLAWPCAWLCVDHHDWWCRHNQRHSKTC